jgi:two-component system OmpR family response regulator
MDSTQRIRRVLVVDDQPALLKAVATILEGAGFQVFTAKNGREASAMASEHQVDLLITDLAMPDEDGIELVRRLKAEGHEMKIIAMSGTFGPDLLKMAQLLGADATISKPMKASQLLDCIRKLDIESDS